MRTKKEIDEQKHRELQWRKVSEIPKRVSHYHHRKLGKLTLKDFGYINKNGKNLGYWLCDCDCGEVNLLFWGSDIYRGKTVGCGCHKSELNRNRMTIHNMSKTTFYKRWKSMLERCYTKSSTAYDNYGAKGIEVCTRWHEFDNFYKDMYEEFIMHIEKHGEDDTSLDRIDSSGHYEMSNCRWATWSIQFRNRSTNRYFIGISPNGEEFIHNVIKDFADEHNLTSNLISTCLNGGQKTHKGWIFRYATEDEIDTLKSGR